jgi:hypothetical protein
MPSQRSWLRAWRGVRTLEGNLVGEPGRFCTEVGRYGRVASGLIRHRAALCSGPDPVNLFQYSKYFSIAFK